MEWFWYWLIFFFVAGGIYYSIFNLCPTIFKRPVSKKVMKEKDLSKEVVIVVKDDPIKNCPICNKEMPKDSLNGIIVDRCPLHGIWFDKGELKSVVDFVKSGGDVDGFFSGLGVDH